MSSSNCEGLSEVLSVIATMQRYLQDYGEIFQGERALMDEWHLRAEICGLEPRGQTGRRGLN